MYFQDIFWQELAHHELDWSEVDSEGTSKKVYEKPKPKHRHYHQELRKGLRVLKQVMQEASGEVAFRVLVGILCLGRANEPYAEVANLCLILIQLDGGPGQRRLS